MAGIAIIGGGPVGLWTACQLKILRPEVDVTVYEKHPFYQRIHPLTIHHSSLANAPDDARIQEIIQGFKESKPQGWFWKSSKISTKRIEDDLQSLATKVGVRILKNTPIENCRSLKNVRLVIGADGSHSTVRKEIFGEKIHSRKQLNRIVEVKYQVLGETEKLSIIKQAYSNIKTSNSLIEEHVGAPNEDGTTPVTLRFFVAQKEYEPLQDATFKKPYTIDQLPPSLMKTVKERLALRAKLLNEVRVQNSEKVSAIPLETYSSSSFVKKEGEVTYCLVGDAAFGVPFNQSLNNGLACGTKLASRISAGLENTEKLDSRLSWYNWYVHILSRKEILIATIKNFFIQLADWIIYINSKMPWQYIKSSPLQQPALS